MSSSDDSKTHNLINQSTIELIFSLLCLDNMLSMSQSFNESELSGFRRACDEDSSVYTTPCDAIRRMSPSIRIDRRSPTIQMDSYYAAESFGSEDDYLSAVLHMKTIEMLALIKGTSPQEAYLMDTLYEMDSDEDGSIENDRFYYVDCSEVNDDGDKLRHIDWEASPAEEEEDIIFDIEL